MASLGDIARNERRKAERRVTALEIKMYSASDSSERQKIANQIQTMREAMAETRMFVSGRSGERRSVESRSEAVEYLKELNNQFETAGRGASVSQERRNLVLQREISAVSRGEEVDDMSETDMRVFWRATQDAWEGAPIEQRYERIYEYYGTRDLNKIYRLALEDNDKIAEILDRLDSGERLTKEQREFLSKIKRTEDEQEKAYRNSSGSPIRGKIASNVKPLTRQRVQEA